MIKALIATLFGKDQKDKPIEVVGFEEQQKAFHAFLETVPFSSFPPVDPSKKKTAFMISSWLQTAVPWYSITLAILYRSRGLNPVFVWDQTSFPDAADPPWQNPIIRATLQRLSLDIATIDLVRQPDGALDVEDNVQLDRLARVNSIKLLRTPLETEQSKALAADIRSASQVTATKLKGLFSSRAFDHLVIPGGIYGKSGLYMYFAKKQGVRVGAYDSGPGSAVIGTNDVAGHCMDVARTLAEPQFSEPLEQYKNVILKRARDEYELRQVGKDRFGYQSISYEEAEAVEKCDVLIPLNIFEDTAGLGKTKCFGRPDEWIFETVSFLLEKTDAAVVVRQHPNARKFPQNLEFQSELLRKFEGNSRFRFVSCDEPVSTYRLLDRARVVLPCSSTVGVEAAALGKQVILESTAYYADLGFVQKASTKQDYFDRIKRALDADSKVPDELREKAWICYFLGQVCNRLITNFTPQPVDFDRWVAHDFSTVANNNDVQLIIRALSESTPVSFFRSQQILGNHSN